MEKGLTKNEIISALTHSPHGKLDEYAPIAIGAVTESPEFLAHLIAWNEIKGQVRDSKIALPIYSLKAGLDQELAENSFAHLTLRSPRELVRAYDFALQVRVLGYHKKLKTLIKLYLREREANRTWFYQAFAQHRKSIKELYFKFRVKPAKFVEQAFDGVYPKQGILEAIRQLTIVQPRDAAGLILKHQIPFLVATSTMGARAKDTDFLMTLIDGMSPTELVTNTKMIEKLGMSTSPVLRSAFEKGLERVATQKKGPTLKTSRAAEAVTSEKLKEKLQAVQQKQIKAASVEGDWLVSGDRSGSMALSIEKSKELAAALVAFAKGKVHLIFSDTSPEYYEVTGLSYAEIVQKTKRVKPGGSTSLGVGLDFLLKKDIEVDGICIVSDGGENHPPDFATVYGKYCKRFDKEPPVYFYHLPGDSDQLSGRAREARISMEKFEVAGVDYYSIPNLIQTMRPNRYSLADEIMNVPLLTVKETLKAVGGQWS